jgi:NAD(P)-dependent dehydrogenase (short-subunit alcohol dehydrogenase family)
MDLGLKGRCARPEEIRRMVAEVHGRFGRIDILVNSIGAARSGHFLKLSDEDWRESLELKLFGIVRCCREVVPHMQRRLDYMVKAKAAMMGITEKPRARRSCATSRSTASRGPRRSRRSSPSSLPRATPTSAAPPSPSTAVRRAAPRS